MAKDLVFSIKITISMWESIMGGKRILAVGNRRFEIKIPSGIVPPGAREGKKTYSGMRRKIDGQAGDVVICFTLGA